MVICICTIISAVIEISDFTPTDSLSMLTAVMAVYKFTNLWNMACFWLSRFSIVDVVAGVVESVFVLVVMEAVVIVVVVVVIRFVVVRGSFRGSF